MSTRRFGAAMGALWNVHRQTLEADHAARARRNAEQMRQAIRTATPSDRLGSGRLASMQDIEQAGLLDPDGLPLGSFEGRMLFYNGEGPLVTYLRTRGGKGRDLILPTLAHVRNRSLIVVDVKDGENAHASAAHRAINLKSKCIFLNPYNLPGFPNTRVNPFQILVDVAKRGGVIDTEAVEVALPLLPPPVRAAGDDWVRQGALNWIALLLEYHALFDPDNCTPPGLWKQINAGKERMATMFALMRTCGIESIEGRAASIEHTADNAPKQFEAYKGDAIKSIFAFEPGKALGNATSAHEFDFAALKHDAHTVDIILPSDKIEAAGPWCSLILNHAIETIARERGDIRTTIILDEFPQLPPAPAIRKAFQLYAARGIQPWIFAQTRFSMEGRWPREVVREFEDQAAVMTMRQVFEPSLIKDIELWSGNKTVLMHGVGHNGGTVETASANLGETRRSVLQSEDIIGLGANRQILRVSGMSHLAISDSVPFYAVHPWCDQILDVRDLHRGGAK